MSNFKEKLRAAKLPERTVPVCLRGDLTAEFEDLERQLAEAQRTPSLSLEGDGSADLAARIEALRAEMREHTEDFVLRAKPRQEWRAFLAAYPPRQDAEGNIDERDRGAIINMGTFWHALIRESVVSPELDDEDWRLLLGDDEEERERREKAGEPVEGGKLTDRQFEQLTDTAWALNRRDVDVPFSLAASRMMRSSSPE